MFALCSCHRLEKGYSSTGDRISALSSTTHARNVVMMSKNMQHISARSGIVK